MAHRPTTTVKYSSSGMFSYRDFVYASRNSASRAELDDRLYRTRLRLPTQMTSGTVRVLSLTATCIAVVAENWNDPTVLDGLAEEHRIHAPAMLTEIARRTSVSQMPHRYPLRFELKDIAIEGWGRALQGVGSFFPGSRASLEAKNVSRTRGR